MPDITTTVPVRRIQLMNLRDVLAERAEHAEDWHSRVAAQEHDEIIGQEPAELADFLFELAGDLDDWRRCLTSIIGDDV